MAEKYVGKSVKRTEDPRLIQGLAHYVDDIKLPDTLHAAKIFRKRLALYPAALPCPTSKCLITAYWPPAKSILSDTRSPWSSPKTNTLHAMPLT